MAHQVQELEQHEEAGYRVEHGFRGPGRGGVVGVQEEVHVDESKDEPVVGAVLEQVGEGHRVIGETMDEQGLEFALQVVPNHHSEAELLVELEAGFPIDLLLEGCQASRD